MLKSNHKRRVKLFISLVYFGAMVIVRRMRILVGNPVREKLVILYYHGVPSNQLAAFVKQLDIINRVAKVVPADYRGPLPIGKRSVAITFDDAYTSVYENAIPELRLRSFPATIFVPVAFIGRRPKWQIESDDFDYEEVVMTEDQLRSCPPELFKFGSHTLNHIHLTQIDRDDVRAEIEKSRECLSAIVHCDIRSLSAPYGDYDSTTIELCRSADYDYLFTTEPEGTITTCTEIKRGRTKADPSDTPLEFYLKIQGAYEWRRFLAFLSGRSSKRVH